MTRISVVIPTRGDRPAYLKRAIESANCADEALTIEVIIALNGNKASNFDLSTSLSHITKNKNLTIKIVNAGKANVSRARNIGLNAATGQIIRFLDDDDFLIPEIAKEQYLEMLRSGCDLSTYGARIEDESGTTHQIIRPTNASDYACAVLGPQCPALPFASIYRKELIETILWNEAFQLREDEDWMRRILSAKDPYWLAREEVVGVWFQHANPRLSTPFAVAPLYMNRAISVMETVEILKSEYRLDPARSVAAARGLWSAIHDGFYFSPIKWTRIAKYALRLDSHSHPDLGIFKLLSPYFHPIIIEWLMLPKRWLNHLARTIAGRFWGWNTIRKL